MGKNEKPKNVHWVNFGTGSLGLTMSRSLLQELLVFQSCVHEPMLPVGE